MLFFLATLPLSAQNYAAFDVQHYDLHLKLSDESDNIEGLAAIKVLRKGGASEFILNLNGLTAKKVSLNEQAIEFTQKDSLIHIPISDKASEAFVVEIEYAGVPKDGLIIKENKHGRRTFFADNWPNRAQYWFPSVDHPSDKATVNFTVTAPQKYQVIANGSLDDVTENSDGTKTSTFSESRLMPTYCMVIGAAEFEIVEGPSAGSIPVSYWFYSEDREDALLEFKRTNEMINYYADRFGAFPFEKLAMVQSSTRFGGMENAGAIFFSERSVGSERRMETTVAHEVAHQWFGDDVTETEWNHLWLSEGFATYFGMQFFEFADGEEAFQNLMRRNRERYFSQEKWHKRAIVEENVTNLYELLNANNYSKGGWVLHMLRDVIGEENFWKSLRAYYQKFNGKNALTQDLLAVFEEISHQNLGWFFKQWVLEPGIPKVAARWQWDEKNSALKIDFEQQQEPVMRFPLDVGIAGENGVKKRVWLEKKSQQVVIPVVVEPSGVVLDPGVKLLAKFEIQDH